MRSFNTIAVLFLISLSLLTQYQLSCTLFSVSDNTRVFFGNNEDVYPHWLGKIFFKTSEKAKFGYMFHGFADGFFQGGMNEKGLIIGWVAGYKTDWKSSLFKKNFPDNLSQKIITECSTVGEALKILNDYNQPHLAYAGTMIADRSGDAVAVKWRNGRMEIIRKNGKIIAMGYGRNVVASMLGERKTFNVNKIREVLNSSIRNGYITTLYSLIYDLNKRIIYLFNIHGNNNNSLYKINLKRELDRGDHYYDIKKIHSQLNKEVLGDYFIPKKNVFDYQYLKQLSGNYRSKSCDNISIRIYNSTLLMKWNLRPMKEFSLYHGIDGNLYAKYRYLQVDLSKFYKNMNRSIKLKWIERDGKIISEKAEKIVSILENKD